VRGKPSDRGSAGIIELNWLRRKTRCSHSGRLSGSSQSPILESQIAMFRQLTGERLQLAVVSDVLMESFPQFEMTYLGQAVS
jgi:hypothetical protein